MRNDQKRSLSGRLTELEAPQMMPARRGKAAGRTRESSALAASARSGGCVCTRGGKGLEAVSTFSEFSHAGWADVGCTELVSRPGHHNPACELVTY